MFYYSAMRAFDGVLSVCLSFVVLSFVRPRCLLLFGRDLQVNYCQESYVYVLTAVRFATVMGCKDCTVVIGAAAGMVSLALLAFVA